MPGEVIDTAFVEIRPLFTGFAASAEAGVKAELGVVSGLQAELGSLDAGAVKALSSSMNTLAVSGERVVVSSEAAAKGLTGMGAAASRSSGLVAAAAAKEALTVEQAARSLIEATGAERFELSALAAEYQKIALSAKASAGEQVAAAALAAAANERLAASTATAAGASGIAVGAATRAASDVGAVQALSVGLDQVAASNERVVLSGEMAAAAFSGIGTAALRSGDLVAAAAAKEALGVEAGVATRIKAAGSSAAAEMQAAAQERTALGLVTAEYALVATAAEASSARRVQAASTAAAASAISTPRAAVAAGAGAAAAVAVPVRAAPLEAGSIRAFESGLVGAAAASERLVLTGEKAAVAFTGMGVAASKSAGLVDAAAAESAVSVESAAAAKIAAAERERTELALLAAEYERVAIASTSSSSQQVAAAGLAQAANARLVATSGTAATATTAALSGGLARSIKGFAGITAAVIAAEHLAKGLRDGVEIAGQLEKSGEAIKIEFGASSDEVLRFAKNASGLGISSEESQALSVRIGILAHNLHIAQPEAAHMAVGLQELAGSIAEIRGIDPSTVLSNLPQALAGNLRSLKQLGFSFSNAQITQEAVRKGALKLGQALTPTAKAIGVSSLLLKQLAFFQAQAATSTDDLVNQEHRLSAETSNIKGQIGGFVRDELAGVVGGLADAEVGTVKFAQGIKQDAVVMGALRGAGDALGAVFHGFGAVVGTLGVPTILAAAVAYKAVGVAVSVAGGIETRYQAILARGAAIRDAAAASNTGLAATEAEVAAATAASTGLRAGLSNVTAGLASTFTKLNLVALGVTVFAGGLVYLLTRTDAVTASLKRLAAGLAGVTTAASQSQHAALSAAEADTAVTAAQQRVEQARIDASNALKASGRNSLAYRSSVTALKQAEQSETEALLAQTEAHKAVQVAAAASREANKKAASKIADAWEAANASIVKAEGSVYSTSKTTLANLKPINAALEKFGLGVHDAEQAAGNAKGPTDLYTKAVHDLFVEIGKLPTLKEIQIRVEIEKNPVGPLNDLLKPITDAFATATAPGAATGGAPPKIQPTQDLPVLSQRKEQMLQDQAALATAKGDDAAEKEALAQLAAFYDKLATRQKFSVALRRSLRVKAAQARQQIQQINDQEASDAKTAADANAKSAKDAADAKVEERRNLLDANLRIAQATEGTLTDDIKAEAAIVKFLQHRVAVLRKGSAAQRAEQANLRDAQNELTSLRAEGRQNQLAAREDALKDNFTLAGFTKGTADDRRALTALEKFYADRVAHSRKGSVARRKWRIELERTRSEIRDLDDAQKKTSDEEKNLFQQQSFSFLQTQQGFAANLASNLLDLSGVSGLVGGNTPKVSAGAPGAPLPDARSERPLPGARVIAAEATREAGGRQPTSTQLETLISLTRSSLTTLREIKTSAAHPEARSSRVLAHNSTEVGPA